MTVVDFVWRVRSWMRDFGQEGQNKLEAPSGEMRLMRHRLIDEENNELFSAKTDAERVDAIADLLVVVVGAAEDAGIDPETLEAHLEDVLNANEAKKWTAGEVCEKPEGWIATQIRDTALFSVRDRSGKIRKPPGWIAPDASRHIDAQKGAEK